MTSRQITINLLERWEKAATYADILLNKYFNEHDISEQEKALVQELFFGVIRWREKLDWLSGQFFQGKLAKSPRFVKYVLQISLYQLLYLDRIPEYAVINEAVKIAKSKGGRYWAGKINAILRNFLKQKKKLHFPDIETSPVEHISIKYSHPKWLVKRWIQRCGVEETCQLCEANNQRPSISLRANRLKITPNGFKKKLLELGLKVEQSIYNPYLFRVQEFPGLSKSELFRQGLFTVQDESAGLACELLAPRAGEKIIDLCAAPGGKTTYLAELSGNQAIIYSVDQNFSRLKLVRENLVRLNLDASRLIQADARYYVGNQFDKVLLDVPCSGLGVLAKRIDLRWKRSEEQIRELTIIQYELLQNAAHLVKRGGLVVYATCTIEPEENEAIIQKFLSQNKNFKIDHAKFYVPEFFTTSPGYVHTLPHIHKVDGSFAVRLIKEN